MMPAPAVVAAGIAAREIAKRTLIPAAKAGLQLAKKHGPKVFRAGKKQAKKAWNWLRKKWNDANKKFSKKKKACEPCKPAGNKKLDEILRDPNKLKGKTPDQVRSELGQTPRWKEEGLGRGSHKSEGWVLREYTPQGNPTGRMVRWHPGGGRHGPNPYWRVTSPTGGKSPIIPAGRP